MSTLDGICKQKSILQNNFIQKNFQAEFLCKPAFQGFPSGRYLTSFGTRFAPHSMPAPVASENQTSFSRIKKFFFSLYPVKYSFYMRGSPQLHYEVE